MRNADKFQKFDYGPTKNKVLYGQQEPPLYDLSKINLTAIMFFGKNDLLISEKVTESTTLNFLTFFYCRM